MIYRLFSPIVPILALVASYAPAFAQVTNIYTEGNLRPTHDLPCISAEDARKDYSPADLATSLKRCFENGDDARAIEMVVVLQLRGEFDARRVSDKTAHGAYQVLIMDVANAVGEDWAPRITAAFEKFKGDGSDGHARICSMAKLQGAPNYRPDYMIAHGMKAVLGTIEGDGLVPGFDPQASWEELLKDYLKCPS